MSALQALLLFCGWTLLLAAGYVLYRIPLVLMGRRAADAWTRGRGTSDPGIVVRAQHAHLNCLENLPVFAAIVLAALTTGRAQAVEPYAAWVLYARLVQSGVHLLGTSFPLVLARATAWSVQVGLMGWMLWLLLH